MQCISQLSQEMITVPSISADTAARALQEYFLANVDRGDDAANDELVDEMLRRMRALRTSPEGGC